MKILPAIILIIITAFAAHAQMSNVHVGIMSGFADSNVTYGVTAGADIKHRSSVTSVEIDGFHLCKHAGNGGCGYEYQARGTVSYYLNERIALQVGVARSQYKVEKYGKSSIQYLVGTRYTFHNLTTELNYRHDLTSPNHAHFIEFRATKFAKHHLFFRGSWVLSILRDSGNETVTGNLTVAAGFHF